jgi:ketosteroid isomerase-like protein
VNAHADLVQRFYAAFARKDAEGMVACYAPDVRFSDPVFPALVGERAKGMWRMLVGRGKDLRLEFSGIEADERHGRAHWEAWYTFTSTGKPVHNVIEATFTFRDGLIATHTDRFDLYRWSRMALGVKGTLLGWTPLVQGAIRRQAEGALTRFLSDRTRSTDA